MNIIRKNPVTFFIIMSFILTYVLGIPFFLFLQMLGIKNSNLTELLMKFGPTLSGIITAYVAFGKDSLIALFRRLVLWRFNIGYYIISILLPPMIFLIALAYNNYTDLLFSAGPGSILSSYLTQLFFAILLGGGLGEELGWRGFLMNELSKRYSQYITGILISIVWFAWHLPAYILLNKAEEDPILPFIILIVSFTFICTKIYYRGNYSLIIPVFLHGSLNASFYTFSDLLPEVVNSPAFQPYFDWTVAIAWFLIAIILQFKVTISMDKDNGGQHS